MGQVVSLEQHRMRRHPGMAQLSRLERSVGRLEASVRGTAGRITPAVERELLKIVRAVSAGRTTEAADRAERLAGLLGHPAAVRG
jgi:hypothetical protein